jgi:NAD(P)-dependent dehydrogenase (short-subunit alcohol dehydrogenase family)
MRTMCVSGAASGIARALSEKLRADGYRVISVDRRDADVIADLSTADGRASAVAAVLEMSGGRLDGVAALAGVGPQVGAVAQATVNYFGAVSLLEGLHSALQRGENPAAIVASSIAATVAPCNDAIIDAMLSGDELSAIELSEKLGDGGVGYSTSKRALAIYVRRNAPAWIADGIRLNALAPGNAHTGLTKGALADPQFGPMMESVPVPRGSWAQPEEIASAAHWALSPAAGFMVGSFFVVDGGTDALVRPDAF